MHFLILQEMLSFINSLISNGSIVGINLLNCKIMSIPVDHPDIIDTSEAAIIISVGESESYSPVENDSDTIIYPVVIAVVDPANQDQSLRFDQRMEWRQTLFSELNHNNAVFTSVTSEDITVDFGNSIDHEAWFESNAYVSELTANVSVVKKRRT